MTADTFRLLGQPPLLGRDFSPADDCKGAEMVVMLGYSIWKNRYGSDPDVIGRPIRVNGQSATIIGVMPDGMKFPTGADAVGALYSDRRAGEARQRRSRCFGRLKHEDRARRRRPS